MGDVRPVTTPEFKMLIAALGPFEARPAVAVAVSGGADSMALCLLAHAWAARRGGTVAALSVDHGLRHGSLAEARQTGAWLNSRGIEHHVLRWRGDKPGSNLQAAARAARYALLTEWCRRRSVLHLLLGHHREDQAETVLLRLGRGSGVAGLAAMAGVTETPDLRLLRPLLSVPKGRLVATLRRRGQDWIEDPSNRDPAYARVRMRQAMPALGREGLTAERLAATAARLGRARGELDAATAGILARAAELHPAGYCLLDPMALAVAPPEIGLRAVARMLITVSGGVYPPRRARLLRLYQAIAAKPGGARLGGGRTLAGCRIVPHKDRILICREARAAAEVADVAGMAPRARVFWDNRFALVVAGGRTTRPRKLILSRLGRAGWAEILAYAPELRKSPVPGPARPSLPALRDGRGVLAVPHLHYGRPGAQAASLGVRSLRFDPAVSLAGGGFSVVSMLP